MINHVKIVDIDEPTIIKLLSRLSKTFVILNDKSESDVQIYVLFFYF